MPQASRLRKDLALHVHQHSNKRKTTLSPFAIARHLAMEKLSLDESGAKTSKDEPKSFRNARNRKMLLFEFDMQVL